MIGLDWIGERCFEAPEGGGFDVMILVMGGEQIR